jgi:hypothetical protein
MKSVIFIFGLILFSACASLILEPSDFAWPIETVLNIDDHGTIREDRYSFSTNVKQLFITETGDSTSYMNSTVRVIRDEKGYYFLISNGFKNVYIFNADDGRFVLINKVEVSEFGLDLPAFNQRKPYIEILEGEQHLAFINSNGIKGEEE